MAGKSVAAVRGGRESDAEPTGARRADGDFASDIPPRPPVKGVVDLPAPYLSQVWDSPDDFQGGGSCGPTSILMALIRDKKIAPNPVRITGSYFHVSEYGGNIPIIEAKICDPELGAVHARMLDYLRPFYPQVAIYYDAKATLARVK